MERNPRKTNPPEQHVDERPNAKTSRKCADILALGRKHFATASAIESIIQAVKKDGVPEHASRRTRTRRRHDVCSANARYGALVRTHLIAGITVGVQSPAAMLDYCNTHCMGFQKLMQETVERHGFEKPWNLILYADGVSPADTLSKNDQRKFWAIYWSFAEFGQAALGSEEV